MQANKTNVLYLGLAFDIMSPLLLVPDLDTIYAIDLVDVSYGLHSWDLHKAEMRLILTCGSDEKSQCRHLFEHNRINRLPGGPATIISDIDTDNCWTLEFAYDGKIRSLQYYHHIDFQSNEEWPPSIQGCAHVMSMGAAALVEESHESNAHVKQMLLERCESEAKYYALTFLHEHFPHRRPIWTAHSGEEGTSISWTMDFNQIPEL